MAVDAVVDAAETGDAGEAARRLRWVLHVDLDQFLAAVEVLRRPELAGLPVVVGGRGDPTERGVVSTASYEARAHGVGSGMPLRVAFRKCPDAVFLPVDKPAYDEASAAVMDVLRAQRWDDQPLDLQVLGWDEAFLGLTADRTGEPVPAPLSDPRDLAAQVRAAVLDATGLHCSVGIGNNRVQAKIATDFGKPRGVHVLTDDTWFAQLGDRPTTALWGIGRKTAARLADLGVATVTDLAAAAPRRLAEAFGPTTGPWLRRLGRGVDPAPVDPTPWVARAHGREETFQTDLDDPAAVADAVRALARRAAADIAAEGRPAVRVGIKVRDAGFRTVQRSLTLPGPEADPEVLGAYAVSLLDRVELRRAVRLVGVRLEMAEPREH
ncbi:MAG: DNA polymerase IV [Nocardioides sp.]|nr:DNA polymerase IV [Nocardioides sp.]